MKLVGSYLDPSGGVIQIEMPSPFSEDEWDSMTMYERKFYSGQAFLYSGKMNPDGYLLTYEITDLHITYF